MARRMIGSTHFPGHAAALSRKKGLASRLVINTLKMLHDSRVDHAPGSGGPAGKACAPTMSGPVELRVGVCLNGEAVRRLPKLQDAFP